MSKIFLGGTCNKSKWRENILIPKLEEKGIEYFNPVVSDWNEQHRLNEIYQREHGCDYVLYVLTPFMAGFYSIAELVEDSIKRPEKTLFHVMVADSTKDEYSASSFTDAQIKSLNAIGKLVESNGGTWCESLDDIAEWVSSK